MTVSATQVQIYRVYYIINLRKKSYNTMMKQGASEKPGVATNQYFIKVTFT